MFGFGVVGTGGLKYPTPLAGFMGAASSGFEPSAPGSRHNSNPGVPPIAFAVRLDAFVVIGGAIDSDDIVCDGVMDGASMGLGVGWWAMKSSRLSNCVPGDGPMPGLETWLSWKLPNAIDEGLVVVRGLVTRVKEWKEPHVSLGLAIGVPAMVLVLNDELPPMSTPCAAYVMLSKLRLDWKLLLWSIWGLVGP